MGKDDESLTQELITSNKEQYRQKYSRKGQTVQNKQAIQKQTNEQINEVQQDHSITCFCKAIFTTAGIAIVVVIGYEVRSYV